MSQRPSTKPLGGMRDLLPPDLARRLYVTDRLRSVFESYGFQPLETPALESLQTLTGKYGEEGDQLLYRVLHRRDKLRRALGRAAVTEGDLAAEGLRYDLTVPFARVMAQHRGQLPRFFRRYQIQPVWRADRPGRGRFREFYQCDLDLTGTKSPLAEAEVLGAGAEALRRLGLEGFTIHLNHRGVLWGLLEQAGVPDELGRSVLVGLDKLDKIGREAVERELAERGLSEDAATRLLEACLADDEGNEQTLRRLESTLPERARSAVHNLREVLELASAAGAEPHLRVAPALARGLDYYTGAIYEVTVPDLQGSLGSGGRYDGLIGLFSGEEIPAVGFSVGLDRILLVMEERSLFPRDLRHGPEICVCGFGDTPERELVRAARGLRALGHSVEVYPEPQRKLGKQLKYASEIGARKAAIVGPDEVAQGGVQLKDLETGEQSFLSLVE